MCVRPCDRPTVRAIQMDSNLVTRNRVFATVTPSSVTKSGPERDASEFSDKKSGFRSGNAIENSVFFTFKGKKFRNSLPW